MIRKTLSLALALVLALLLCSMPVAAQPPGPPTYHIFWGTVTIDANPAPDGATVSAYIGSLSWSTTTRKGKYGYDPLFSILADDPTTPEKDGGAVGDEIIFKVNGIIASTAPPGPILFEIGGAGVNWEAINLSIGETAATYSLTVSVSPSGGGTVALSPSTSGNQYESGTTVTVTANPASGYVFDHWSGDLSGSTNPTYITMDADKLVTAHFRQIAPGQYSLIISSTAGGEVTEPGEGTFAYDAGKVVELEASPDTGYEFDEWTGDVGTVADVDDATTTITMDGNKSVTANFEEVAVVQYDLTISSAAGGSVTIPGEGTFTYNAAEVVNLEASPDDGYQFDEWTGDVADVNASTTTITMDADKSITAGFSAVTAGISPASFSASGLQISPQQVQPDQPVEISIDIANNGGATGSHTVLLYINGSLEDSHTVSISPGSLQNVVFTVSRSAPGTYEVSLEGLQGQFTVAAPSGTSSPGGLDTSTLIVIVAIIVGLIVAIVFVIARIRRG